jgi:putative membrane protein
VASRFNWPVELHPILVHFPIALLCFAFALDLAAWVWKSQPARSAALYSLTTGAVATLLAVLSGLVTPEAREHERRALLQGAADAPRLSLQRFFSGRLVEVHKHWGYVLLALVVVWLIARLAAHRRPARWQGVAMGAGVLALIALLITGYYGGDLVYGRRGRARGMDAPAAQAVAYAATPLSTVDSQFLGQAGNMGNSQAALAGLAARRAASPAVRRYARRLVTDHARIERQLEAIAPAVGVALPVRLDGPASRELSRLSGLSGSAFDREFLRFETADFRFHVQQFTREIARGTNPILRRFATAVAPVIRDHARTAEALASGR